MASVDNPPLGENIGSVTRGLRALQAGEVSAVEFIWRRYYERVVQFAGRKMLLSPDRAVDGEDIAQIAMNEFCSAVQSGRYQELANRDQLWDLLAVFTLNRIRKHLRACNTLKRSGQSGSRVEISGANLLGDLRSPEAPIILQDLIRHWLQRLDQEDPTGELRQIAVWTLEDVSGSEIARILKKRKSVILQRLRLIRLLWEACED